MFSSMSSIVSLLSSLAGIHDVQCHFHFIDGKCHIKQIKGCKTGLTSYYACLSCELLLMPLGQTHTYAHTNFSDKCNLYELGHPLASLKILCNGSTTYVAVIIN